MNPKEATVELRNAIRKMRDEELEHMDIATENDAAKSPAYNLLNSFIQAGCKAAILAVSKF
jgi:ubiquinone biosynthesis monooxygenase Coq7